MENKITQGKLMWEKKRASAISLRKIFFFKEKEAMPMRDNMNEPEREEGNQKNLTLCNTKGESF